MAIKLRKYKGELTLYCEVPTCRNRGEYIFGEEKETISRNVVLCKRCVNAIKKAVIPNDR